MSFYYKLLSIYFIVVLFSGALKPSQQRADCVFLPNSAFGVVMLIVWNQPWWKYLHYEIVKRYKSSVIFYYLCFGDSIVKHLPAHHWLHWLFYCAGDRLYYLWSSFQHNKGGVGPTGRRTTGGGKWAYRLLQVKSSFLPMASEKQTPAGS